jgi:hypothetical protein
MQNGVDMQSSLVDAEGFPRNDIDIYAVRNARHTIACKKNGEISHRFDTWQCELQVCKMIARR